jgi:hypothetical protein
MREIILFLLIWVIVSIPAAIFFGKFCSVGKHSDFDED